MEDGRGLRAFRDHVYRSYRLSPPVAWPVRGPRAKQRGIMVWNKRYSADDRENLSKFLTLASLKFRAAAITFDWVHWPDYTFEQQLELLSGTAIYITGPGTAIMNQPFLPDGSAVIALGTYRAWSFQSRWYSRLLLSGRQMVPHPGYMEQFMSAGVDYTRTLYYPLCNQLRRNRSGSLYDPGIMLTLVREAVRWIRSAHPVHAPDYRVNLAPDGRVVDELLKRDETFRRYYRDDRNHHDCGHSDFQWPEIVVRSLGGWGEDAPFFFHRCRLNATVLDEIKREQGFVNECV